MMMNKLTPLEILHQEKALLKIECNEGEERLAEHWDYIRHNVGSLILHSAVRGVGRQFGLVKDDKPQDSQTKKSGLVQGLIGSAIFAAPAIWSFVQPIVMGMLVGKVKNIFFGNNKDKKKK